MNSKNRLINTNFYMKFLNKIIRVTLLAQLLIFAFANITLAQNPASLDLNDAKKIEIVNKIISLLNDNYVFPETAGKMETLLRGNLEKGEYKEIKDAKDFTIRLTNDLQSVSHDLHLRVSFSPEVLPPDPVNMFEPTEEEIEPIRRQQERDNYGVRKVEILKGNVGLIRFDYFTNPAWAGDVYTTALNYVVGADALIIDLRFNGGSMNENAIPFICSYFFEKPVHLNDIYWRPENFTRQFWTYAVVPGKRFLNKPIYVLTSNRTFSGAEEITYDLKNLKRATIVGESTGGGAHGGSDKRINDHFSVWIPLGRAINPITKTNWEGTGVSPDVEVISNKAFYQAQLMILADLQKKAVNEQIKLELQNAETEIKQKLQTFKKVTFTLKGFENAQTVNLAGDFNGWSRRTIKMIKGKGVWTAEYEVEPGRYGYKFVVDGKWITDPANSKTEVVGDNINSVIEID
jgi:hypothetical protein